MSWFPLSKDLIEGDEFRQLTPATRLFYLILVSEFNLRDRVRKSDCLFATMMNVSVRTVMRARKDLKNLGWIRYIPGYKTGTGRGMVSRYLSVRHAKVKDLAGGDYFAECDRATFEAVLYRVSEGRYDPADLLIWVLLEYWQHCKQEEDADDFFITTRDLIRISGMADAPARIGELANYRFKDGTPLFTCKRDRGKFKILSWVHAIGPDEDDDNKALWDGRLAQWQGKAEVLSQTHSARVTLLG